jgi:hypothetical protein
MYNTHTHTHARKIPTARNEKCINIKFYRRLRHAKYNNVQMCTSVCVCI